MAQTLKREAINALESMPDDAVMDDIMYRLYVLDKVKKGLKELDMGNYYVSENVEKEIESW